MSFWSKLKDFVSRAKKVAEVNLSITEFVSKYRKQIAAAMKLVDTIYDANEGSVKMQSVIKTFITAINKQCGYEIPADLIGTDATRFIEYEYEKNIPKPKVIN